VSKRELITKAENDIAAILAKLESDLNGTVLEITIEEVSTAQVGAPSRRLRRINIVMRDQVEWSIKTP
jgi:hypothetical protein